MHCDYERTVNRLGNRRHCNFVKLFLWLWPLLESCSTLNTPVVVEVVWGKRLKQRRHKIAQIHFRFLSYGMTSSYSLLHPQKIEVLCVSLASYWYSRNTMSRSESRWPQILTWHQWLLFIQLLPVCSSDLLQAKWLMNMIHRAQTLPVVYVFPVCCHTNESPCRLRHDTEPSININR